MIVKIILKNELNEEELRNLELLFHETERNILDSFLILTDSLQLCRMCRKLNIAVAAVLAEESSPDAPQAEDVMKSVPDAPQAKAVIEDLSDVPWVDDAVKSLSDIPYAVTDIEDIEEAYLEKIWRRYRGIPWDICETERCLVRETTVEDVDAFYRIYAEKSITEYMDNLFEDMDEERQYARDYIEKVYGFYGYGMWTVCLKETGEVIGRAGLCMREGFEEPELGYVIGVPWQGQGIATEVCRAILEYGREELGFRVVRILMKPGNKASERLCKKLGFQYIGETKLQGNGVYSRWRWEGEADQGRK